MASSSPIILESQNHPTSLYFDDAAREEGVGGAAFPLHKFPCAFLR